MAQQTVNIGSAPNDSTGDSLRAGGTKINANFTELYQGLVPASAKTASYTLVLADAGTVVEMNVASANTFTVPPNSAVAFPVGTLIEVCQIGAGTTTIAVTSPAAINHPNSGLAIRARYASVVLRKRATDEWILAGDTV
jgi:hypothetical protein